MRRGRGGRHDGRRSLGAGTAITTAIIQWYMIPIIGIRTTTAGDDLLLLLMKILGGVETRSASGRIGRVARRRGRRVRQCGAH